MTTTINETFKFIVHINICKNTCILTFKVNTWYTYTTKILQFHNGVLALTADKFINNIFIDNKLTQLILETFDCEILDIILYSIPVEDKFIHEILVLHLLTLFISFVI